MPNTRRFFHRLAAAAILDLTAPLAPARPDHIVRLLGYQLAIVMDDIVYSTTATWMVDVLLDTRPEDYGSWGIVGTNFSPSTVIDAQRFDGGVGRVVTSGGYLIKRTDSHPPVVCDLEVPSLFVHSRRLLGLDQAYVLTGWIDFQWVKATPTKIAAVGLAWNVQLGVQT